MRSFRIVSRDPHPLYEASCLFLLSQIGAALDRKRMHRIHALCCSVNGRAVLVLLPMGGGRSTPGDFVLRHPEVKLLADDSAFVDAAGGVHAFPLHLGLPAGSDSGVPEQHRRFINRMGVGPKFLVNYEYVADRVVPFAKPGVVFLGSRTLARDCRIEPASMTAGLRGKARVGWSRLANCHRLLRRSQIRHLYPGRDLEKNAAAVVEFARRLSGR